MQERGRKGQKIDLKKKSQGIVGLLKKLFLIITPSKISYH